MALKQLADLFQPVYYRLEKSVAAKSIPAVHEIPSRKKLSDFEVPSENTFDHSTWDSLLKKYVSTCGTIGIVQDVNLVDYENLSKDTNFDDYLKHLAEANPSALPEPEQMAFWINSYNALCISLLVNYLRKSENSEKPKLASINNLSSPEKGPVWNQFAGVVGGKKVSLNDIEHKELRGTWDEPAVHGSIVCASASCPNLRPEAFCGTMVREQMDDQMRQWMKNTSKGLMLNNNKQLLLSRIFLWFGDDFGG